MSTDSRRLLGWSVPSRVEDDPGFRADLRIHTQYGMRVAGILGMLAPLIFALGHSLFAGWHFTWSLDDLTSTATVWVLLCGIAPSAAIFALSRTSFGARHGRLLVAGLVLVLVVLANLDQFAARGTSELGYGLLALLMILAVGTIPYRPSQAAALGGGVMVMYVAAGLAVAGIRDINPPHMIPDLPIFMSILTVMSTGVSALIYRGRYESYRAFRDEEELRSVVSASEAKFRGLFENSGDGIFVYSHKAAGFLMVNPAMEEMLGMTMADLSTISFFDIVHPDDRERAMRIFSGPSRGESAPTGLSLRLISRKSDEPIICGVSTHRADDPDIVTGTVRDITVHVKRDEQLKQLAQLPEMNPGPVLRCDYDGEILYMNPAARRLTDDVGRPDLLITALLPDDTPARIQRLIDTQTTILDNRHTAMGRTFSLTYRPLQNSRQIFIWIVDVTERIRASERVRAYAAELETVNHDLRETQMQLVQSEKMAALGNLVAGVAHEINTPVGSIHANADVSGRALRIITQALGTGTGRIAPEHLEKCLHALSILQESNTTTQTATKRIVAIVRSLRNFARLDEAELKDVDLHEGIESTLTLVHHEYKGRIQIVRDFGALPLVRCSPNQMNQIFMNILVNAIHAIEGAGTITITTRLTGPNVTLAFGDTGIGIDPAVVARVFDPGFTTRGVGVGTGLGLSIAYKIVDAHDGQITVASQPGEGTTFTVTLPVRAPIGKTDEQKETL